MTTQGKELQRRSKTWNPRRWLGVRRDIKKFSETSFDLYILTVVLYSIHVNAYLILTEDAEKIKDHRSIASCLCCLRGYYPGFRYNIESTR